MCLASWKLCLSHVSWFKKDCEPFFIVSRETLKVLFYLLEGSDKIEISVLDYCVGGGGVPRREGQGQAAVLVCPAILF